MSANLNIAGEASVIVRRSLSEWDRFAETVLVSTDVNPLENKTTQLQRKKHALSNINNFVQTYLPFYSDNGETDCAYFHEDFAKAVELDPNIFAVAEWPREHAKTVYCGVVIPLMLMVKNMMRFYLHLGRTGDLAEDHIKELKFVLENSRLLIHDFSPNGKGFRGFGSWEKDDFITSTGIRFKGLGRGQAPQGTRDKGSRPDYVHFCDLDDYEIVKNEKRVEEVVDWILGAVIPAASIKGSRVVVDGNRIHQRSILANIVGDITLDTPKREGIYHNKVYATQSPGINYSCCTISNGGVPTWQRYNLEELKSRFAKVGPTKTLGEYYHIHAVKGKIFTEELINFIPMKPLHEYKTIVGYFDPSFTNKPTSDYKAVAVWGLHGRNRHCLKRFTRQSPLHIVYEWMWNFQCDLPSNIKILWYIENQFINEPFRKGLAAFNRANKAHLHITPDRRTKGDKYMRIMTMEPIYHLGEVYFNSAELHNTDMITGNNQLKGIEPGYRTPDDAPDADEGAWYFLSQHIYDDDSGKGNNGRTGRSSNRTNHTHSRNRR